MSLAVTVLVSIFVSLIIFGCFAVAVRNGYIDFSTKNVDAVKLQWLLDSEEAKRYEVMEDLTEANRKIRKLEHSEASLRERVEELEKLLLKYSHRDDLPTTPLLLICGDKTFCDSDTTQFNRAKVWFRVLENATKSDVINELARRRQSDDLYPWLHISAHGNEQGILLSDGVADPTWWNRQLDGIKVLFAANCNSITVGDALAGLCDHIVVFYGERSTNDVEQFTFVFWRELMNGTAAKEAYRKALTQVPQVRPFVDMRSR